MGVWSNYDDGNDRVADLVMELETKLLPKSLAKLPIHMEKPTNTIGITVSSAEIELNLQMRRDWMTQHPDRVQRELNKMHDLNDSDIAGIARYIARRWGQDPSDGIPSNLDGLPKMLRKRAYEASKAQLNTINREGWKDTEERRNALKEQMRQD